MFTVILDEVITVNGERVMSGKSKYLKFANRKDAVSCFAYYVRITHKAPYVPWVSFFDCQIQDRLFSV